MKRFWRRSTVGLGWGLLVLSLGTLQPAEVEAQDGFRLIVHPTNPRSSITPHEASWLFLRKVSRWEHGTEVSPVDLPQDSPVRRSFTREIHGKSVMAVKAYWNRVIYSGGGLPPPVKGSEREVVEYVKRNEGAIGYVSSGTSTRGVKVLRVGP